MKIELFFKEISINFKEATQMKYNLNFTIGYKAEILDIPGTTLEDEIKGQGLMLTNFKNESLYFEILNLKLHLPATDPLINNIQMTYLER